MLPMLNHMYQTAPEHDQEQNKARGSTQHAETIRMKVRG